MSAANVSSLTLPSPELASPSTEARVDGEYPRTIDALEALLILFRV